MVSLREALCSLQGLPHDTSCLIGCHNAVFVQCKALGIELRASSALAVPISTKDGTLLGEPLRIRHKRHIF